jgi:hypothetical protein
MSYVALQEFSLVEWLNVDRVEEIYTNPFVDGVDGDEEKKNKNNR